MTIAEIVERRGGRAGRWRVTTESEVATGRDYHTLYHYSTPMLVWRDDVLDGVVLLHLHIGWGSVSDQNGMNKAFKTLRVSYYYSRAGGAEINYTGDE